MVDGGGSGAWTRATGKGGSPQGAPPPSHAEKVLFLETLTKNRLRAKRPADGEKT